MQKRISHFPDVHMIKNSLTHDLLLITKFYGKTISVDNLKAINPKKFNRSSHVKRSLLKLHLDNLIHLNVDNTWKITSKGIAFIYDFAAVNPSAQKVE
jgi:hypothetical protein